MKTLIGLLALAVLANCAGRKTTATFLCLNGPDLAVTYVDDLAIITFVEGRTVELQRSDPNDPDFYSAPGISWTITGFRAGRLNDGRSSHGCDQVG